MKTVLLASLLALPALVFAADGLPNAPYVAVNGRGDLKVAPDMAYITLTLEKTAADAGTARADVEARTAKVLEAARKAGISDKDIDAPSVSVEPDYEWVNEKGVSSSSASARRLIGQHVIRTVTLTLRDLAQYGELADGLFRAGVTSLDDVSMDRSDRAALEQKARTLAVADAHERAAGLVQSAGVNLGPVYSITEQGGGFGPRPMAMARNAVASGAASPPEYLDGKLEISAEVSVLYLIDK